MKTHTPTPWKIAPANGTLAQWAIVGTLPDGTEHRLALIVDGLNDRARGNARLIAAAPDLLEALRSLMKAYGHPFTGENGNSGECWDLARAAIAKATGEEGKV